MLKPGDKAPDFTLTSGDGATVSLKQFRGSTVVLYFYPKDDTSGCTKEACDFNESLPALKRKGAVVIGVSADSESSHASFAEKYGLRFPLLSDPDRNVLKAYGVWKEKSMYGRTFMGIERTTFVIDGRGVLTHVFARVKVPGHVEEVRAII